MAKGWGQGGAQTEIGPPESLHLLLLTRHCTFWERAGKAPPPPSPSCPFAPPSSIPHLSTTSMRFIYSNYHFPSSFFIHIHPEPAPRPRPFPAPPAFFRFCFVATLLLLLRLLSTDRPGRISPQTSSLKSEEAVKEERDL